MTFFKPFKNHPNGPPDPPPAPPRWIAADTNGRSSWPEDDFDNGDVYEPPPYERPAIIVQTQPTNLDLIYHDRSSDQPAPPQRPTSPPTKPPVQPQRRGAQPQRPPRQCDPPQRPIPPPMRPAGPLPGPTKLTAGKVLPSRREAEVFHDPSFTNPPKVDRQEKPGKSSALTKSLPPPVARPPPPGPPPDTEEDVYVDPNEEQGDSDGGYLKPTPALPLPSRPPKRLPPISSMVAPLGPICIMKPPVPRTMNNSLTSSVTEMKPAPDGKRPMLALPPQKDSKPGIPSPPTVDQIPGVFPKASSTGMKSTKATGNEDNEWFTGVSKRKYAEDLLLRINKDGAFLIRPSSSQDPRQPYTLAVLYREKVYNIPIRFVVEMQGYALGKVGKDFEDTFPSLQDIIVHHKKNQLVLIDSMSQAMHKTYLVHPARP